MKKISKRVRPHIRKKRFYNHPEEHPEKYFLRTLCTWSRSFLSRLRGVPCKKAEWLTSQEPLSCSIEPTITWIGHATFLIQVGGVNILTDPVFGHASRLIYRRILPPGVDLKNLPNIDYVVISHNHRDHMDAKTLLALKKHVGITILVPQGDKAWFDRRGFKNVKEMMWWDKHKFPIPGDSGNNIVFTFLPAKHWSQRGLFDKNKSLWGSWMIQWQNSNIYFAGDTAYSKHFGIIAQEFEHIDVALMPIGPCTPRKWLKDTHISSDEAGQAFLELGAKHFIPMHWGTFYFGVDRFETPLEWLEQWWHKNAYRMNGKVLHSMKIGQQFCLSTKERERQKECLLNHPLVKDSE